jgi:hypothetical protein
LQSKTVKLLLLILLLGAGLRFTGNRWGLPNEHRFTTLYVDEYTPLHWLSRMHPRQLDFNPHDFRVPTFFYYQIGAALQLASTLKQVTITSDQTYYLQHPGEYARLYLTGRTLTALYGITLIVLMFFLGKKISGSEEGGLLDALFYAVVPLAVVSCHVIDVGVPVSFWLGLCFLSLISAADTPRSHWLWIGALAAGLSFSTKYTSAPVFLLVGYTLYRTKAPFWMWSAAAAACAAGFLIGTPYALLDHTQFLADFKQLSAQHAVNAPHSWRQLLAPFTQYPFAVGTVLSGACAWGIVRQAGEKRPAAILAALFLVPYLFLLGKSPFHITRYLNETLPFLLPFAAVPFLNLNGRNRWIVRTLLLILCLSRVPYTLAINRSLASEKDPRDRASDWIVKTIPPQSTVGLEFEANFLTPGQLYMQYWKDRRYPASQIAPPNYHVVVWDEAHKRWPDQHMTWWVQNNLLYSGLGRKDFAEIAQVRADRDRMEQGFHAIQSFERDVSWGPFRYPLPPHAGWEWIIFFPKITLYSKNQ